MVSCCSTRCPANESDSFMVQVPRRVSCTGSMRRRNSPVSRYVRQRSFGLFLEIEHIVRPSSLLSDTIAAPPRPPLTFPQPSPVLDFVWYPFASHTNPASFCFLTSVRECPVKLLDAADGRVCIIFVGNTEYSVYELPLIAAGLVQDSRSPRETSRPS